MKTKFVYSLILFSGLVFASPMISNVSAQKEKMTDQKTKTTATKTKASAKHATKKYTCTMHPDVVMNKPGKCPKCGMNLVEKKESKTLFKKPLKQKKGATKVKEVPEK